MYYYVYDEFVQDPKFERDLAQIETRLTDLGISGKIARLALFRDASELIRDEVGRGVKTVVAVGNDLTLRKVIDASANANVAIGIIPLGGHDNFIADMLGVPGGVAACEVISARNIEEIDTGVVNSRHFINKFECVARDAVAIECDDQFILTPSLKSTIEVRNMDLADAEVRAANPADGKLEIVIRTPKRRWFGGGDVNTSIIPVKKARIFSQEPISVTIDGEPFESNELKIKVIPRHLKLIISKHRKY